MKIMRAFKFRLKTNSSVAAKLASIAGSNVGDLQYSPIWRINAVTWKDPAAAKFLTMASEISAAASGGMLGTEIAGFVVNCPFVEVNGA